MVFSLLDEERLKWQKVRIRAEDICLDRKGIKGVGAGTNQIGILRGGTGLLTGLTEMAAGYKIWLDRISTSYGTQPVYLSL